MLGYAAGRVGLAVVLLLVASVGSFALLHLTGDPATALVGSGGSARDAEVLRQLYGLDRPLPEQFVKWLGRAVVGDFGYSRFFDLPVASLIGDRLPTSLLLGALSLAFALAVGLPLGVLAALRPNSWIDRLALLLAVGGQAMPSFWFALILIVLFGVIWPVLPISGLDDWTGWVLPTVVLGYSAIPALMRLTRTGMLEILGQEFIRAARAKGLPEWVVVLRHALGNAIVPVVGLAAVQLGALLAGSIVVEAVFAINGTGSLAWESIRRGDLPTVQALVLLFSGLYVVLTLLSDLLNAWLDPRIRLA